MGSNNVVDAYRGRMTTIQIRLPKAAKAFLWEEADKQGLPLSPVLRAYIGRGRKKPLPPKFEKWFRMPTAKDIRGRSYGH
jgi:hypothetical protein